MQWLRQIQESQSENKEDVTDGNEEQALKIPKKFKPYPFPVRFIVLGVSHFHSFLTIIEQV